MKVDSLQASIDTINGSKLELDATLFSPDSNPSGIQFFCLPGGSESHDYFNLGQYDGVDHSFVSRMTALGHEVITMDHPGTGNNPISDTHPFLKPRQSSDYIAQAIVGFQKIRASNPSKFIGVGHSMGGMMTILTQARHQLFDGVALFGSSANGLDWGLDDHEKTYVGEPIAVEEDLEKLVIRKFQTPFPGPLGGPSGKSITFGGATPEITERLREISIPLYAAGGMLSMIKGSFAPEVEAIDVPLFLAFGDHDIGAPPEETPAPFTGTDSIELHVLDNCGHNSFAFPVIETLCAKLDHWASRVTP